MDLRKLKGNLGLKSSALAPTACKLSSQFLVLDHMSNHYTKIAKAKSAVDSRPPKSLVTSQKMRDRINRHRFFDSPQPRSQLSVSATVLSEYEDVLKDEPEDEEEKLVHAIMRSTLLEKSRSSNNARYSGDQQMEPYQQMPTYTHETSPYSAVMYDHPPSVRSNRSGHSVTSSPSRLGIATSLLVKRTCKGDVLEKRPHLFTEPERPFTPRTLKKNTESRLKNSKCYNPPRNKSGKKENIPEIDKDNNNKKNMLQNDETDTVKTTERGRKINKQQSKFMSAQSENNMTQKVNEQPEYDLEVTPGAQKLSNSRLMDVSLRSRDETYNQEMSNGVPPLAITVDKDHMNWLQEQASKAEIRVRSSARLKSSLHPDQELYSVGRYRSLGESGMEPEIKMEKLRRDEEQKYLTFAKEVTDNILCRGISSDSVLDKVFENHIVRHKDDLDEGRMRKVISDLRNNIGLKDSVTRSQVSASLSDNIYNNRSKVSPSDNNRSKVSLSDNNRSKVSPSDNNRSKVSLSDNNRSKVLPSDNNRSKVSPSDNNRSKVSPSDNNRSKVSPSDNNKSKALPSDNNRSKALPSVHRSESEHTTYQRASRRDSSHMHSASDVNSTLESESTLKFGQTEDVLSTINSEARPGDKESENMLGEGKEMAVSQTLREYQLSLADQEDVGESVRESEHSIAQEDGLASSPETSHVKNDEDSSVASSVLSQRPVARPRTRARHGSHERTQAEAAAGDDEVVHQVHQDNVHSSTAGSQDSSPTAGRSETTVDPDDAGPGHTGEHAGEAAKPQTDHPQAVEEDDEYEDDYEEIIESENDSADDF